MLIYLTRSRGMFTALLRVQARLRWSSVTWFVYCSTAMVVSHVVYEIESVEGGQTIKPPNLVCILIKTYIKARRVVVVVGRQFLTKPQRARLTRNYWKIADIVQCPFCD